MVTRAVSAGGLLTPLVDLALLAAIVGTPVLAIWAGGAFAWEVGILVGLGGAALIVLIGRPTIGLWATVGATGTTWLTLGVGLVVALAAFVNNCAPNLDAPWAPWTAMGIIYACLGLWSLRTAHSVWGLPLSSALAISVGLVLAFTLPGTPGVCD